MKMKYKDIIGDLAPEEYFESCRNCCFNSNQLCVPYKVLRCVNTIFVKSESQVFEV